MSTVPGEIAGIGSTSLKLRVSPGFDPLKAAVGPEEYFVLSRIDGTQSLRDVLLATGLAVERAIAIVTRLRSIGALLLPGESAAPAPAVPVRPSQPKVPPPERGGSPTVVPRTLTPASPSVPRTMTPMRPRTGVITGPPPPGPVHDTTLPNLTQDEADALAEASALAEPERRRILAMTRIIETRPREAHALLGVPLDADQRTIKLAYFQLSKEIHPDRYYGKQLGTFLQRMTFVFEAASRAYARLTTTTQPRSSGAFQAVKAPDQPQTPQEYANELFERACQVEVGGDALEAMKLFAAAVRMDPQVRYMRRAASCALAAHQPKSAVEYAKKAYTLAPNDPSSARLLASAFRAAGKLADAEEVLVMAMAIKSENDVLTAELRNDLAEVRRLLAAGPA